MSDKYQKPINLYERNLEVPDVMVFFEGTISEEYARTQRTREAPAELPDWLRKQVNEHRQQREGDRERLVARLKDDFRGNVREVKDHMLAQGVRLEPRWMTNLLGLVFAKKLERLATAQARDSDLATLRKYDRDTREQETDFLHVYEMSRQPNRHDGVTREPQRGIHGGQRNAGGSKKDRGPERER